MSPRPGGEADKIGNRYEGYWTVRHLLGVLAGDIEWVRVEPLGVLGDGVEFVLHRPDGVEEAHQVKRQRGNENEWTTGSLTQLGIWTAARRHIESGREYHLVSAVPFRPLQELTERIRTSNDYKSFTLAKLPKELDALFVTLTAVYDGPEETWKILRNFYVRLIDELELRRTNGVLAGMCLAGASGQTMGAALGDVVDNNLDIVMTSDVIMQALRTYDISRRLGASRQGLAERIRAESAAWLQRVGQQLMRPAIARSQADDLRAVTEQTERVHFCLGAAGGGKTAVLHQAVEQLLQDNIPTLVLRLDKYGPLASTDELGTLMGLDVSPVSAVAAAASGSPAVLVIDQLDAVSLASGRLPENFDAVTDIVLEASAFPNLHVVLGCRQFDVDNDHRILGLRQNLQLRDYVVGSLTDDQIDAALRSMDLDPAALTAKQRDILRLPLHLSLLSTVANQPNALDFTNGQRLFDAYWEHKRRAIFARRGGTRFDEVVGRLTDVMSSRQRLQIPASVLDVKNLAPHADVLVSEQLLVRDGKQLGFFHEALFDYAFARQWSNRGESLVAFLLAGEQELFRRAQVRQIMVHLRGSDDERFVEEVENLLGHDSIRFHIKDVALAVLAGVSDPSEDESRLLVDLAERDPVLAPHIWSRLRTTAWFTRLDADGVIEAWLQGSEDEQNRAVTAMTAAAEIVPERLVELLTKYQKAPQYPAWLRWVAWRAPVPRNRPLFDLFLTGIRDGIYDDADHDLWLAVHNLGEQQPTWAVEVLHAYLVERRDAFQLTASGKVTALEGRDHQAIEIVKQAVAGAPQAYCDSLLPYLLRVMALTAYTDDGDRPIADRQFSHRFPAGDDAYPDFDDALYLGMAAAIKTLVAADPIAMRPTLETLALDPHDSAQWLLYQGLTVRGAADADWAAELLLQGTHRLLCGNMSNASWATREVLLAVSGDVSDELHRRLEDVIRDFRHPRESRPSGWTAFNLLSALDERRLSPTGQRRLGELRRSFKAQEPTPPIGITGGFIESPIKPEAAERMSDTNWLQAMAKHSADRENWRNFTGGARELSNLLKAQTVADPQRFAKLATRLTAETNPAYGDAVLMGLAEAPVLDDGEPVFAAVRHIASLHLPDNDRWLGYALRRYAKVVPLDLVELVRDRALDAVDPPDNDARFTRQDGKRERNDLYMAGINGARGSLAESLGDMLIVDVDGTRTALVSPMLVTMVQDPVTAVRTGVANVVLGSLRYARPAAIEAFHHLIDGDDRLLATDPLMRLMMYLGNGDPEIVRPVVARMLASDEDEVREAGGELVMRGALQWGFEDELQGVLAGDDVSARTGVASTAAHSLPHTSNTHLAAEVLSSLSNDPSPEVRAAVGEVAGALRGHDLRPFANVLRTVMESPTFRDAHTQLFYTLEAASDRTDDLALLCSQRFIAEYGTEAGDLSTAAAGDARHIGQMVIRGLAQSKSAETRAALLDVLDGLLAVGAYGIEELIQEVER